jgi:hypothetical protein
MINKLFRKDKLVTYSMFRNADYEEFINSSEADEVKSLINSPANLFLNLKTGSPALCLSLENDDKIILNNIPQNLSIFVKDLLISKDYNVKKKETLIEVKSSINHNSSFLFLKNKEDMLQKFFEPTDTIKCLISDRINLPIYFGHFSNIERLAENNDYEYKIFTLEEVLSYE